VGRNHVSVTLESSDGKTLRAIAFRVAEEPLGRLLLDAQGKSLHLAGTLSADHWQGAKRPQLRVLDAAVPVE
jgi:single-stranded-DNA-specific exonuclease